MTNRATKTGVLAAAMIVGLAACGPPSAETAVAGIQKLGGKVTREEKSAGQPVMAVDLSLTWITDAGLGYLKGLPQLQTLDLSGTKVTDAGLEHLKGLPQLQTLSLSSTAVTDAGLEHLKGLTQLQTLNLRYTAVTDAGLEHLKGLTQLQELDPRHTAVTDAGVNELKKALPNVHVMMTPLTRKAN